MGLNIGFSSSIGETNQYGNNLPNPKPDNYKIIKHKQIDNNLVLKIKYLDCINYEGNKILVFKNCTLKDLQKQQLIDPHFCKSKKIISPIARFEPTAQGWLYACNFTEQLIETVIVNENTPIKPKSVQYNVAIKGDGTARYGARIYKYFLNKGIDMGKLSAKDFKPKVYYSIEDNGVVYCPYLSEGLEEKTLKKIK